MKDLGQINFFLVLQLEHHPSWIMIHQAAYIQNIGEIQCR
jgi:hypothetical protein